MVRVMIILSLILFSCGSVDYYNSDSYLIKQRQKESLRMMKETHKVRRKCSKRSKPRKAKRKRYYS